jgi:16S rRNA (guanine527-N7)-methyltransferase
LSEGPLDVLEALLRDDPLAPIADSTRAEARRVHIDDSMSGLEFEQLRDAGRIADVGSGAGLPGLVLAAELREAELDLIESVRRKCEFMERAAAAMGLRNAGVVNARAERCGRESARERSREPYGAVTARAVARLSTLAELASPLLREGGHLLAWKGRRDPGEEAELERGLPRMAMEVVEVRPVTPYPGSRDRHIHLLRKNGPTPNVLPRRDGLAAKRPFGAE